WTFRSGRPAGGESVRLPASTVRFGAATGLDSKVTAGRKATFPVTVEGPAKGRNLKSLSVFVSYDHGRTWKKTELRNGMITVRNPAKGKAVSLRAVIVDKKNNTSTISVHDAYHGK
ncbi:peptidase S8, partial [Streptomyces sp. NPDC006356]